MEGRCNELQEVATIIGRPIASTRRRRSMLVSDDTRPGVVRHLTTQRGISESDSTAQPGVVRRLTTSNKMSESSSSGQSSSKTGGQEIRDSPPAKKNCGASSSGYLCQSEERGISLRSIVVIPPQSSMNSGEIEKRMRDRLVEKLKVKSSVPCDPSGISTRNRSTDERSKKSSEVVEEGEIEERSNPKDHFLGPLNETVRAE